MPTAGEYKHEPSGIPCHCYVRRRINHSLCIATKSCLRKSFDLKESSKLVKKVTFDPVLRIRGKNGDYSTLVNEEVLSKRSADTPNETPILEDTRLTFPDDRSQLNTDEDDDWSLRDKITSFFAFGKSGSNHNGGKRTCHEYSKVPVSYKPTKDINNNVEHSSRELEVVMKANKFCRSCDGDTVHSLNSTWERTPKRGRNSPNRSTDKYHEGKSKDSLFSPGGGRKFRSSSSSWEYNGDRWNSMQSRCHSPQKCECRHNQQPRSSRTSDRAASRSPVSYYRENGSTPMGSNDWKGVATTFVDRNTDEKAETANTRSSNEEKSDEYIYATADNPMREYEYIPVKLSNVRRRTESENFDNSPTIPTYEANAGYMPGLVKHKTESDLSGETAHQEKTKRTQDSATPQSAPDLQTIMSTPYHIKFLNECIRAYTECERHDKSEVELDIFAEIHKTEEKFDTGSLSCGPTIVKRSLSDEISRMAPVALFWTGCAFLVALIYIFLFSCAKANE